jgi:hypothetical protein
MMTTFQNIIITIIVDNLSLYYNFAIKRVFRLGFKDNCMATSLCSLQLSTLTLIIYGPHIYPT